MTAEPKRDRRDRRGRRQPNRTKGTQMSKAAVELRACRTSRGMNQRAFAKLIGVSQGLACRFESGKQAPGKYTAKRIASVCGVAVEGWGEPVVNGHGHAVPPSAKQWPVSVATEPATEASPNLLANALAALRGGA